MLSIVIVILVIDSIVRNINVSVIIVIVTDNDNVLKDVFICR